MSAMSSQGPAAAEVANRLSQMVHSFVGIAPGLQVKVLLSVVAVASLWLVRRLVLRVASRRIDDPRARYQWSKSSGYAAFLLAVLLLGQIWLEAVKNLGTFLGLLSAGLAIALRDLVANTAGWAFILLRHPFTVGDRIQVGEHRGDVVDIRLFQFTLLEIGGWVDADQSTGRVIHVPNAKIFSESLANYTAEFPYIWHELPVLVTFESDWRRAKQILLRVVQEEAGSVVEEAKAAVHRASRKFLIFYRLLTPDRLHQRRRQRRAADHALHLPGARAPRPLRAHLGGGAGRLRRRRPDRLRLPDAAALRQPPRRQAGGPGGAAVLPVPRRLVGAAGAGVAAGVGTGAKGSRVSDLAQRRASAMRRATSASDR